MRIGIKLLFVALFGAHCCMAQGVFLRIYNYRPTGDYGFAMKPGFSAEIGYSSDFESRVRFTASATFQKMRPRMSEFPIYGVQEGNGTSILPGTESFQKYNVFQMFAGLDVAIVKREKFFFYGGFDLVAGAASVDYTDNVETFKNESYSGGGYLAGGRVRVGAQYDVTDHIGIIAHIDRVGFLINEPAAINFANNYGIGLRYQFD